MSDVASYCSQTTTEKVFLPLFLRSCTDMLFQVRKVIVIQCLVQFYYALFINVKSCSCWLLPRVGPGYPLPPLLLPCPFTFSSFALYYFFPFSFSYSLYLFSSIVHPISFYQNRPTPFPGERS